MQASVNGSILLLNAEWYEKRMAYGFSFATPKEVARFIDVFCLRDHFWFFKIEDGSLRVYSLAPYGTHYDEFKPYSEDFLRNIKHEAGNDEQFWAKYLCTSMYFSGVYAQVNYITSYPKSIAGEYPQVLIPPMTTFAKCFKGKNYLPDLIVRHRDSVKSQYNRQKVDHPNQLNTIHLRSNPLKPNFKQPQAQARYAKCPLASHKTVCVLDDVCSMGMSFEAARTYIRKTGTEVICVSLLKALKHDYQAILEPPALLNGPFHPNEVSAVTSFKTYPYRSYVVDKSAPADLADRLNYYRSWDWPCE
jgi:hypothetical protein